jgi:phosphoglycolate phosphatase
MTAEAQGDSVPPLHIPKGTMKDLTLVFDLDGTLVDTAPDLVAATNHVLQHIGLPTVDEKSLRPFIGQGAHYMVEHAMGPAAEKLTLPERTRLLGLFLDFYGRNIAVGSRPFEGTLEALDSLSRQGAKLAVCTNKMEHMSRSLLEALGMSRYFASIAGRDTLPTFKPDPGHLLGTIELAGGDPARAIMIGDSRTDIDTAKAAKIPVIAVSFGYTDTPVVQLSPDAVIDHYRELEPAIVALMR